MTCDIISSQQKVLLLAEYKRGDKMTNIGIVRKVDSLGRVTLPKEMRDLFEMQKNEVVEILATDKGILLRLPNVIITRVETERDELFKIE